MTNPAEEMKALLLEIEGVLPTVTWRRVPGPLDAPTVAAFVQGSSPEPDAWHFIVTAFDIEPQGFPPGSIGYDGTATNHAKATVIRLTRELAAKAFALSLAATTTTPPVPVS